MNKDFEKLGEYGRWAVEYTIVAFIVTGILAAVAGAIWLFALVF